MSHIIPYYLFEKHSAPGVPGRITIQGFLSSLGFPDAEKSRISEWWAANRGRFQIHLFPFKGDSPILGVFLGDATIAINQKSMAPPPIKLFVALHESRHADQHLEGRFEVPYFQTVVAGDREGFLAAYSELEREANDYALDCMRELGFERFMTPQEGHLRGNEIQGPQVYNMMRADIERVKPQSFFDLLMHQVV